jgi:hypothetical protein
MSYLTVWPKKLAIKLTCSPRFIGRTEKKERRTKISDKKLVRGIELPGIEMISEMLEWLLNSV